MINNKFHGENLSCQDGCCSLCCTKINNLSVQIGRNKILENINLHIHCGEFTAIIGPNGSGKSTLLKSILGEISHDGNLVFEKPSGKFTRKPIIGYVPQTPNFEKGYPVTVLDLFVSCVYRYPVVLHIPKKIRQNVINALKRVRVEHLVDKKVGVLSGGELQRVLLALALQPNPEILLLDEPVSGVDITGLEMFYEAVNDVRKEYDLSVVIVSHDMELVEKYSDRVVLINKNIKKIGTPKQVLTSQEFKKEFRLSSVIDSNVKEGDI